MSSAVLLPASFAILLAGALLFTNAIEWFGTMVGLGQGAVGSLLAAVATALPESLIAVVAIVGGEPGSSDVAIGAIVGAPLLLATAAMVPGRSCSGPPCTPRSWPAWSRRPDLRVSRTHVQRACRWRRSRLPRSCKRREKRRRREPR